MKKTMIASLLAASAALNVTSASEIMLSKAIKSELRQKIEHDLDVIENFKFTERASSQTLRTLGIISLNSASATEWLNKRVSYIISENALSVFNLLVKRVIYVERKDVDFPNAGIIPYSIDEGTSKNITEISNGLNAEEGFTVMSNIGTALYLSGKNERQVYGIKVSRGFLRKSERVAVNSPRAGIIQIGEGLFAPELTVNRENTDALSNSIFRLGTFFHEARHSDGNGKSLGFMHATCPAKHDYEGQPACDENLNGPYTVGALMMTEMTKSCDDNCSEKDKQTLKLLILDSANRILTKTHKREKATAWDATPESL